VSRFLIEKASPEAGIVSPHDTECEAGGEKPDEKQPFVGYIYRCECSCFLTRTGGMPMSKQTLFRHQKQVEALHKISASIEGKNKLNFLRSHRPDLDRPRKGFSTERGLSRFQMHDYRTLLRKSNPEH
jgi:hypothetical protein